MSPERLAEVRDCINATWPIDRQYGVDLLAEVDRLGRENALLRAYVDAVMAEGCLTEEGLAAATRFAMRIVLNRGFKE